MRLYVLYKISPKIHKLLSFYFHAYISRVAYQIFKKPSGTMVYLGVNTGESLAKLFYKYEFVYGFEANPNLAKLLKKRFNIKCKTSIRILNYAVGNEDKMVELNIYDQTNNFANSSLGALNTDKGYESVKVKMINLGNYLKSENIKQIDSYISDIEGYDYIALSTMTQYIEAKKISKIQCETVVDGIKNPYQNICNYESQFNELLDANYSKVAYGWGNLNEKDHKVMAGYRFRDVLWHVKN